MHLVLAKVDQTLFEGEAYSLTAPTTSGEVTILSHHEPLITTLKSGVLLVHAVAGDEGVQFPIEGGVLEAGKEGVTVIL